MLILCSDVMFTIWNCMPFLPLMFSGILIFNMVDITTVGIDILINSVVKADSKGIFHNTLCLASALINVG